jgi:hypothetical protein
MPEISRRMFMWLAGGGSIALATNPPRKLVNKLIPQVNPPVEIQPGEWQFFATTCRECPTGCGMHLWHRDGRVTKAEGNPAHPVNRGGLCARGQSSLQGLYDPDRLAERYGLGSAARLSVINPSCVTTGASLRWSTDIDLSIKKFILPKRLSDTRLAAPRNPQNNPFPPQNIRARDFICKSPQGNPWTRTPKN